MLIKQQQFLASKQICFRILKTDVLIRTSSKSKGTLNPSIFTAMNKLACSRRFNQSMVNTTLKGQDLTARVLNAPCKLSKHLDTSSFVLS